METRYKDKVAWNWQAGSVLVEKTKCLCKATCASKLFDVVFGGELTKRMKVHSNTREITLSSEKQQIKGFAGGGPGPARGRHTRMSVSNGTCATLKHGMPGYSTPVCSWVLDCAGPTAATATFCEPRCTTLHPQLHFRSPKAPTASTATDSEQKYTPPQPQQHCVS